MTRKTTESYGTNANGAQTERRFSTKRLLSNTSRCRLRRFAEHGIDPHHLQNQPGCGRIRGNKYADMHARSRDESLRSIAGIVARPSIHTPRAASADGRGVEKSVW